MNYQPLAKKKSVTKTIKSWIISSLPTDIIEKAVHLIRHQCRLTLQLCAVLSQLNEHERALEFSKKSSNLAKDLSHLTQVMVQRELNSKVFEGEKRPGSTKNLRETTQSNYKAISVIKGGKSNQIQSVPVTGFSSVRSSMKGSPKTSVVNVKSKSNYQSIREAQSQAKLNSQTLQSERESLERIHTFSLKEGKEEVIEVEGR